MVQYLVASSSSSAKEWMMLWVGEEGAKVASDIEINDIYSSSFFLVEPPKEMRDSKR